MKNIPEGYLGFICLPELITGNGTYKTGWKSASNRKTSTAKARSF